MEGFSLQLNRSGRNEEAVFDFSYTPIRGDDGIFCGLFGVCIETTARVLAERNKANATSRQRRQFEHEAAVADGETVLVVDDEATIRMLLVEILGELGYRCIEAIDGVAALQALQREPRIDLLITDVGLSGGLNGRQIADAARQQRPELKILFITGYAENAVIGNGHLDRGMEVITKPFVMTALAAKIRDMMEQ